MILATPLNLFKSRIRKIVLRSKIINNSLKKLSSTCMFFENFFFPPHSKITEATKGQVVEFELWQNIYWKSVPNHPIFNENRKMLSPACMLPYDYPYFTRIYLRRAKNTSPKVKTFYQSRSYFKRREWEWEKNYFRMTPTEKVKVTKKKSANLSRRTKTSEKRSKFSRILRVDSSWPGNMKWNLSPY